MGLMGMNEWSFIEMEMDTLMRSGWIGLGDEISYGKVVGGEKAVVKSDDE